MNLRRTRANATRGMGSTPSRQAPGETLVFRASFKRNVFRDFEVAGTCTLYGLAETIISVFGFDFDHAFGFYSNLKGNIFKSPVRYELFVDIGDGTEGALSVKKTRASRAFPLPGSKMRFLFDYGDEWVFLIELVKTKPMEAGVKLPRLLASVGNAPEQYAFDEDED